MGSYEYGESWITLYAIEIFVRIFTYKDDEWISFDTHAHSHALDCISPLKSDLYSSSSSIYFVAFE